MAGSIARNFGAILADGGPTSTAQNVLSTCLKLRYESPLRQDQVQCLVSVTETKGTQTSELYPWQGIAAERRGSFYAFRLFSTGEEREIDLSHSSRVQGQGR